VAHWGNGTWGRLTRRDVYLHTGQIWRAELRQGDAEGRVPVEDFINEADARAYVERALGAVTNVDWKELLT